MSQCKYKFADIYVGSLAPGGAWNVSAKGLLDYTDPVRSEVFTAVTIKNGVFWDVTLRGSCKNRRFGGI
jgi:hypothetical protein